MKKRSAAILFLLLFVGALLGSALWSLLDPVLPQALARSYMIGTTDAPLRIDLNFVTLTLGLVLKLNIGMALGMVAALVLFYKQR